MALPVDDLAPELPIQLHELGVDCQRCALLRRVDARLCVSEPLGVARRHGDQGFRRVFRSIGAHLRHHFLNDGLDKLCGAVFGETELAGLHGHRVRAVQGREARARAGWELDSDP